MTGEDIWQTKEEKTVKLKELIMMGKDKLASCGIADADTDSKIFAMHCLDMNYTKMFMSIFDEINEGVVDDYMYCIDKRCSHVPTQYIIGRTDFMGYEFFCNEKVLIPRPETELLVDNALKLSSDKNARVLDICCGTGCIGISYLLERRKKEYRDELILSDISDYATATTNKNLAHHELEATVIKSDLFNDIYGTFDMILSNPPYIRSQDIEDLEDEVKVCEPRLALDGHEDGLHFYRLLIKDGKTRLNAGGVIILEIGYDQYQDVKNILDSHGFKNIKLTKDYAGLDRIVSATNE